MGQRCWCWWLQGQRGRLLVRTAWTQHSRWQIGRTTEPGRAQTKMEAGLFKGRHFDQGIIVLCVRWYLRYKLSFRDLAEMMAERGLSLAHTTIMRWIQCYVPEFEKRWNRFARPAGRGPGASMRPTSKSEAAGRIFTALSTKRKHRRFPASAPSGTSPPPPRRSSDGRSNARANCHTKITLDGYQASHRGAAERSANIPREIESARSGRPNTSTI